MQKSICFLLAGMIFLFSFPRNGKAYEASFTDTRFQGVYTQENLDAILEEYELYDQWFWCTQAQVPQTFHGQEGKMGWTESSEAYFDPYDYTLGWYGCRWNWDAVEATDPNGFGWGECFGFCQFLGYLLSGERNPHGNWPAFDSIQDAQGLRPGDILRIEYTDERGVLHQHSAMVYSVDEESETVLFLQVAGTLYNLLNIRCGFTGAGLYGSTSLAEIARMPGLRVMRAEENLNSAAAP